MWTCRIHKCSICMHLSGCKAMRFIGAISVAWSVRAGQLAAGGVASVWRSWVRSPPGPRLFIGSFVGLYAFPCARASKLNQQICNVTASIEYEKILACFLNRWFDLQMTPPYRKRRLHSGDFATLKLNLYVPRNFASMVFVQINSRMHHSEVTQIKELSF